MIHWTISMIQILNHRNMKTNMITLLSHIHSIYSLTCQDEMRIFRGSWQPNGRMVASHASNIRSVEITWQWGCRNCFNHSWNILKYTWFGSNEILCASYIRHKKSPLFCGWHRPLWPAMRRAASHAATFPLDPSTCRVSAPAKTFTFRGKKQLYGLLYTMYMPAAAYVLHLNFSLELPFVICLLIKVEFWKFCFDVPLKAQATTVLRGEKRRRVVGSVSQLIKSVAKLLIVGPISAKCIFGEEFQGSRT